MLQDLDDEFDPAWEIDEEFQEVVDMLEKVSARSHDCRWASRETSSWKNKVEVAATRSYVFD